MSKLSGLEKITPIIIKFPFQQLLKSIINIRVGRKVLSSTAKIIAFFTGLGVGYFLPEIGNFMAFILNLFVAAPLSSAVLTGLTVACSMILTASAFVYLTKKLFQMYNNEKYGVTNSELRLTERDRKNLFLIFTDEDPALSKNDIQKKIDEIDNRIKFLVNKIRIYKISEKYVERKTAKYALNCLKRGDMSVFEEIYEDIYQKRTKLGTDKIEGFTYNRRSKRYDSDDDSGRFNSNNYWEEGSDESNEESNFTMQELFSDDEKSDYRGLRTKYRQANNQHNLGSANSNLCSNSKHRSTINLHVSLYKKPESEKDKDVAEVVSSEVKKRGARY